MLRNCLYIAAVLILSSSFSYARVTTEDSLVQVRVKGIEFIAFEVVEDAVGFMQRLDSLYERLRCQDTFFEKTVIMSESFVGADVGCPNCLLGFSDIYSWCPEQYEIEVYSNAYPNLSAFAGSSYGFIGTPTVIEPTKIYPSTKEQIGFIVDGQKVELTTQ